MANPKTLARVHSRGIWEQAEFQQLSKLNFISLAGVHSRGIKIVFTLAGFTLQQHIRKFTPRCCNIMKNHDNSFEYIYCVVLDRKCVINTLQIICL